MQTYEFNASIENGVIHIPEIYRNRAWSSVKVILGEQKEEKTVKNDFTALSLSTKGFKFDREEANER